MSITDDPEFGKALDLSMGRGYTSAIAAFEQIAARLPDSAPVQRELGYAYMRRAEAAVPEALKPRDDTPSESARLRSSLGSAVQAALGLAVVSASKAMGQTDWIVRYREDFRRAATALERSIDLSGEKSAADAEAYYALAQCLRYLGRNDAARDASRNALALAPENSAFAAAARALDNLSESGVQSALENPTWDDIILPKRTKRELKQMQVMLEDPQLAASLGVEPPTGLLLYGPPGTGKTTIARILTAESHYRFFSTSPAEINSMWLGESEKQVKKLFDQARAAAPSIVFLDEIDALLPSRSGGVNLYSDKVVNQFLHEMDGLRPNRRIFVVGATNRRDMLDPALLRGGRLSREIEIPLPDEISRVALLELFTRKVNLAADVDLRNLAGETDGFSGASIRALVNDAGMQALLRLADEPAAADRHLTRADFDEALINSAKPLPTDFGLPGSGFWRT